jgi:hypothetical protein
MVKLPSVVGVNSVSYAIGKNSFAAVGIIVANRIDQFTSERQQRCYALVNGDGRAKQNPAE